MLDRLPRGVVLKYYLYQATTAAGFVVPIWAVYLLDNGLGYTQLFVLDAAWMAATVVAETPTGWIGDRIGRRRSIVVSLLVIAGSLVAFTVAETFPAFLLLYVTWAVGQTFRSGSDVAWLYDALSERVGEEEFARVRGRGTSVLLVTSGVTSVVGGYLAEIRLAIPFLFTAGASVLGIGVVATFPAAGEGDGDEPFGLRDGVAVIRDRLLEPPLRSFVLYLAAFYGVVWSVGTYIQPVGLQAGLSTGELGWVFGGFTAASAVVSYFSGTIKDRIGLRYWFAVVPLVVGALFVLGPLLPVLFMIPVFFVMRVAMFTTRPLQQQYINDHTDSEGRATVLSAVTMLFSLVSIPVKLVTGPLGDRFTAVGAISVLGGGMLVALV
ncbi:MAG: MFS transporter, partial [Halobaculum sp.]